MHGRTRQDKFDGQAEYQTIRSLKQQLSIPLIANGDIDSVQKAKKVMDFTQADAIMIGRAAHKKPWIFQQINQHLNTGEDLAEPDITTRKLWLLEHLQNLYNFYGENQGLRIARKHINWQLGNEQSYAQYRALLMSAMTTERDVCVSLASSIRTARC